MASFDINDEFVRRLARLLDETGLTEIELAEGQKRIRVTRAVGPAGGKAPGPAPPGARPGAPAAAPAPPPP
ncbi:MAG: acetyl-CoA carboxylase biotin carboxyl carrier protein, partial [Rhodospirillales bacterium]